jgi:hypothetical protein
MLDEPQTNWSCYYEDKYLLLSGIEANSSSPLQLTKKVMVYCSNFMEQGCPQASDIHFISKFSLIKTQGPVTTKPITGLYLEVALCLISIRSIEMRSIYTHFSKIISSLPAFSCSFMHATHPVHLSFLIKPI